MRSGIVTSLGLGVLGLALSASPARLARAEELPPDVRQARQMAAEFPAPSKALGFQFFGQGRRTDATEVELSVRIEPQQEGQLKAWKITETWSAKAGATAARRVVEALLAPDLTPLKGSTFEDGTSSATRLEWLGGERVLALQLLGSDKRVLRSAWYAGQPVVEVGGALLWARLMPRTAPPCRLDFCAPSWNRLTGDLQGFFSLQIVAGQGPDIEIQEPSAPEVTRVETWAVRGSREDKTQVFQVLVDVRTGWPRMVTVGGTTYAGEARPL